MELLNDLWWLVKESLSLCGRRPVEVDKGRSVVLLADEFPLPDLPEVQAPAAASESIRSVTPAHGVIDEVRP